MNPNNLGNLILGLNLPPINPVQSAADFLPPIGATLGAVAGTAIPGLGETGIGEIGGAMGGYNVGQGIENIIPGVQKTPILSPQNGINTVLAGVTQGVGNRMSKGIINNADQATLKNLKTTPSDLTNFAQKHGSGTGLMDYVNKFKQMGWDTMPETFNDKVLQPLYQKYNDLLGQGNVRVDRQVVANKFDNAINAEKAKNPANPLTPTAQSLEAEKNNTLQWLDNQENGQPDLATKTPEEQDAQRKTPPTNYDARTVNARKSILASATPQSQFTQDPAITKNVSRKAGSILRESVNDAAAQAGNSGLKQTGIDLNAAEGINDIANDTMTLKQAGVPIGGNTPLSKGGLLKVLTGGSLEGGVTALLAHHLGLDPQTSAIIGTATGAGMEGAKAKFGPAITSGTSAMLKNPIGNAALNTAGQYGTSLIGKTADQEFGQGNPNNGSGQNGNQSNNHGDNSSTYPLVMQAPSPINGINITQNYNPKTAQWNLPDAKSALPKDTPSLPYTPGDINEAMSDPRAAGYGSILQGMLTGATNTVNTYLQNHNVGADQISFVNDYPQTLNNLNTLENAIATHPTGWLNSEQGVQYLNSYNDPTFGTAMGMLNNQKIQNIKETQGRAPNITELQQAGLFPAANDSPQTAISKLNQVQAQLQENYVQYAPYVNWANQVNKASSGGSPIQPQQAQAQSITPNSPMPSITPAPFRSLSGY